MVRQTPETEMLSALVHLPSRISPEDGSI